LSFAGIAARHDIAVGLGQRASLLAGWQFSLLMPKNGEGSSLDPRKSSFLADSQRERTAKYWLIFADN